MEVETVTNGHVTKEKMEEEKVEMKEVTEESSAPVHQDGLEPSNGETKKEEKSKPSRNIFSFIHRQKQPEEKKEVLPEVTETKPVVAKSPRKWFWEKPKKEGTEPKVEKKEDGLIFGLNLDDRDEKGINDSVKLSFEDILSEPEGYHSFDFAWRLTFRIFVAVRSFFYKLLAVILAIPCALLWGVVFALLTVLNVWACVPAGRALVIPATWIAKVWNWVVRSIFDPCFRSCGLALSSVRVSRLSDVPPALPAHSPPLVSDPAQLA